MEQSKYYTRPAHCRRLNALLIVASVCSYLLVIVGVLPFEAFAPCVLVGFVANLIAMQLQAMQKHVAELQQRLDERD